MNENPDEHADFDSEFSASEECGLPGDLIGEKGVEVRNDVRLQEQDAVYADFLFALTTVREATHEEIGYLFSPPMRVLAAKVKAGWVPTSDKDRDVVLGLASLLDDPPTEEAQEARDDRLSVEDLMKSVARRWQWLSSPPNQGHVPPHFQRPAPGTPEQIAEARKALDDLTRRHPWIARRLGYLDAPVTLDQTPVDAAAGQRMSTTRQRHGRATRDRSDPIYKAWKNMKQRCTNPNHPAYRRYGPLGYDPAWNDFEVFDRDMRPTWSPGHVLDRRNNDLGYSKENCRWATNRQNARNR